MLGVSGNVCALSHPQLLTRPQLAAEQRAGASDVAETPLKQLSHSQIGTIRFFQDCMLSITKLPYVKTPILGLVPMNKPLVAKASFCITKISSQGNILRDHTSKLCDY